MFCVVESPPQSSAQRPTLNEPQFMSLYQLPFPGQCGEAFLGALLTLLQQGRGRLNFIQMLRMEEWFC
jgi:hypothetical protein